MRFAILAPEKKNQLRIALTLKKIEDTITSTRTPIIGMLCRDFHLLMRLGHAVSALSAFKKKLKKFIKENGCSAMLKKIKGIIFNPWLTDEWYADHIKNRRNFDLKWSKVAFGFRNS
jgi:hypothetical protein